MECVFVRNILYSNSPPYVILTYINSTLREFLPGWCKLKRILETYFASRRK